MMDDFDSLSHSRWECKYHVVFIPKCRRKVLYAQLRGHLGEVFRRLAQQKESRVEEGHLMSDHIHMLLSIPPKYAVSQVVGYMKGKSAIHLARVYGERKQNFVGQHFWARGYFVSTVGRDEQLIREYIKHQEQEDERLGIAHRRNGGCRGQYTDTGNFGNRFDCLVLQHPLAQPSLDHGDLLIELRQPIPLLAQRIDQHRRQAIR